MCANLLTLAKWLPATILEYEATFLKCKTLRESGFTLMANMMGAMIQVTVAKKDNTALPIKELEDVCESLENIVGAFSGCFQDTAGSDVHPLLDKKFASFRQILVKVKLQLCFVLQSFISDISPLFVVYGDVVLSITLRASNSYNSLLDMDSTFHVTSTSNSVCNNTCPYLMFPLRKFSVTKFLQILASARAEHCCHRLIDCLLETYTVQDNSDEDSSDNSSVEIYMALTKHLSPPAESRRQDARKERQTPIKTEGCGTFLNLENMLADEETNALVLLKHIQRLSPMMLGKDFSGKSKKGGNKLSAKMTETVLEYYEQILWAEVGNYLEHVILWWAASPLASRPPRSSQHLREWISTFVPTADVPPVILSALTSLADALGVHIASTLWDNTFRQALIAAKITGNPETGKAFCNVLQELVCLCNLYEITSEWIVGAPLIELPLVEQIPVLHRLGCFKFKPRDCDLSNDRASNLSANLSRITPEPPGIDDLESWLRKVDLTESNLIHTTRLWAISECRKIANTWNVKSFFAVTHQDIVNCLVQLNNLRLADHTIEIEKGSLAVHVEVCALMRAKLVSEVKENIQKLKDTPAECIQCLASICKIINLANLQMIFPPKPLWKIIREEVPSSASSYVAKYLDKMLLPVLKSVTDDVICNMVLTLICQSWLDHIYAEKIKFSRWGAFQLLCDFAFVSVWIGDCPFITEGIRKKLLKNEILRRCEGVGRLLLRSPGERLKMVDKKNKSSAGEIEDEVEHQQMPAEMYVPNQEQWLELRASRRKSVFNPLCC